MVCRKKITSSHNHNRGLEKECQHLTESCVLKKPSEHPWNKGKIILILLVVVSTLYPHTSLNPLLFCWWYAEDVTIWEWGRSIEELEANLQKKNILELEAFSETMSLPMVAIKTEAAIFHDKRNVRTPQINMKGTLIQLEANPVF